MSETTANRQERTDAELSAFDGRPDDCDCGAWNAGEDLPCWPCYRDGFDQPNPNATD